MQVGYLISQLQQIFAVTKICLWIIKSNNDIQMTLNVAEELCLVKGKDIVPIFIEV